MKLMFLLPVLVCGFVQCTPSNADVSGSYLNLAFYEMSPPSPGQVDLDTSVTFTVPPESPGNDAPLYLYWYLGDRLLLGGKNKRELTLSPCDIPPGQHDTVLTVKMTGISIVDNPCAPFCIKTYWLINVTANCSQGRD